ncbi:hypothetical protein G6F24_018503 [Rhizopus arrhizus]|nr:hypothetical protein G6F24_018503 [Rhizopus arrhizus]
MGFPVTGLPVESPRIPPLYLLVERLYSYEQRLSRRPQEAPHPIFAGPQPVGLQRGTGNADPRRDQAQPLVVQFAKLARRHPVWRRKHQAVGSGHRSRAQGCARRRL